MTGLTRFSMDEGRLIMQQHLAGDKCRVIAATINSYRNTDRTDAYHCTSDGCTPSTQAPEPAYIHVLAPASEPSAVASTLSTQATEPAYIHVLAPASEPSAVASTPSTHAPAPANTPAPPPAPPVTVGLSTHNSFPTTPNHLPHSTIDSINISSFEFLPPVTPLSQYRSGTLLQLSAVSFQTLCMNGRCHLLGSVNHLTLAFAARRS